MKHQDYRYHQLDDSADQIRLISILPKQSRKRLCLELGTVSITEVQGQYEAVSYTWGFQSPERNININGKTLRLRDNIWRCLKHIRDHDLTKSRLWIDSICINQHDDYEKSQQVAKMGRIFTRASRVLIWLGSTSLQTYLPPSASDSSDDRIEKLPPHDFDAWLNFLGRSDPRSRSLENQIMSIVYNPYWERLWIIQEVALAQDLCLIFGEALLGKDYISTIYMTARDNSKPGYHSWMTRQKDPMIVYSGTHILDHHPMIHSRSRTQYYDGSRESFRELIKSFHSHHCTDPRDYVFGLVGLLDPPPRFQVDYSSSCDNVAAHALHYLQEEEATNNPQYRVGLDITAAAALLQALTVTSSTYSKFEQELSTSKAEWLQARGFRFSFKRFIVLYAEDSIRNIEVCTNTVDRNRPGASRGDLQQSQSQASWQVKLLNGSIKQFVPVRDTNELHETDNVVVLCWLALSPAVVARKSLHNSHKIEIAHFIWPHMTTQPDDQGPWTELEMPTRVKSALQREINACGIDWNDLFSENPANTFVHLSTLEVVSLCEMIIPVNFRRP
ncbi:uncharacterized protein HMPREF1541_10231 [Cyphellophora europaea CBS 101466]|uniref:Heterokaryon incompatibility domain-containing protein n=1 Tax=Cyphellophora europaea (strain CBS 101466) TaxID=1220924 RepID=W2S772_CYPE1|nr:uncharacterized protein HMPREF1541_10231 [Cyphellophora europaea CBS 101466]ETN44561.1 hypothetical protein HMPREF1541_10231 [Cyphellophora europaea CBS 101466]